MPSPTTACKAVWALLADPTLQRQHVATAWRILHGALMTGALRFRLGPAVLDPTEACCQHCAAAGRPGQLDSLTHAFLDCPAVAPALDWLLAVFAALTGHQAPRDPLVLLAAAPWVWVPPSHPQLWHRLRIAFLGQVWEERCLHRPQPGGQPPDSAALAATRVVEGVVRTLTRAITRDRTRLVEDPRQLARGVSIPTVLFNGRTPSLTARAFQLDGAAGPRLTHAPPPTRRLPCPPSDDPNEGG